MAILHGSWLPHSQGNCLFIWGEVWRTISPINDNDQNVLPYPFAITAVELSEWLRSSNLAIAKAVLPSAKQKNSFPTRTQIIALPTHIQESDEQGRLYLSPIHSATLAAENTSPQYLQPWQLEGLCLSPKQAAAFLTSLPLSITNEENSQLGGDLRFWSQIARWCLDLISRCKFLPSIKQSESTLVPEWQALVDSAIDRSRLEKFAHLMPLTCRTYNQEGIYSSVNLLLEPQQLLLDFLNSTINAQIIAMVNPVSGVTNLPPTIQQWLQGLTNPSKTMSADAVAIERLTAALKSWTMPLQYELLGNQFRTCFQLRPPESNQMDWTLAYYLQATDNPDLMLDAQTIWNHPVEKLIYQNRTINNPQETFLRGLGLASRLYPLITASLSSENPQSCRLNPIQAYEFIKSVAWRFEDNGLGVVLPPSLANRGNVANRLGLKITAQTSNKHPGLGLGSILNFQWELAIGGQTISKAEFDSLVALNSPLVEINGEWVELRSPDIKTAQAFFTSRKDQMALSLEDALRLASGDTQTIEKLPVVSFEASGALQELVTTLTNTQALASLPTPVSFQGQLRPYQERGMAWLVFLENWGLGACLADDMGLGKTIQFIAFLLHLKEKECLDKSTLLVCPTSVLGNWEREVKKFAPTLKVLQYHGDKRPKGKAFLEIINKYDLVITSYSLIHRDVKTLQTVSWHTIVLDEAQNVKNSEAKQSQAVRQLTCNFRLALTGTPVENRLQELWSIMDFLNPGYLGNRQFFQRRFAIPIEKYGDVASLNQLRSLVQPFILRRLKTDKEIIQDLPEKQEMTLFCGLYPEQAELYQQVVEQSLNEIEAAEGIQRRGMILALLVKLKQVCNHPAQYLKKDSLEGYDSGKLQRLLEMLDVALENGSDRVLIFTQFAEWGKLLKPYLEKQLGHETFFLYGGTNKKQRDTMIDRFQHDPQGPPVMILSLKAGGVGLNLTRANHVFHFDRWWNPAVENQATDRVFRIGQTRNVQVHKFVCTGTLEEKIHDIIESKKQLAEQVVGAGEDWLTELNTNQLRDLLLLDRNAVIDED